MQYCMLIVSFMVLVVYARRIRMLRCTGYRAASRRLCFGVSLVLGATVYTAMLAQEMILFRCGQLNWRTGLPLHLCSCMGLLSLPMLLSRNQHLAHLLLYLGAPGAAVALMFPAVANTPWPQVTEVSFVVMHVAVLLSPVLMLLTGWRPGRLGALEAALFLGAMALVAMAINALTGGNYLFLQMPPPGTPLCSLAVQWGLGAYRAVLASLALAVVLAEHLVMRWWMNRHPAF